LKDIASDTFQYGVKIKLENLCVKHLYLLDSSKILKEVKERFRYLRTTLPEGVEPNEEKLKDGLALITKLMSLHFGKKAVILIDEYDAPGQTRPWERTAKKRMLSFLSGFFGSVFKDNPDVEFIVVRDASGSRRRASSRRPTTLSSPASQATGTRAALGWTRARSRGSSPTSAGRTPSKTSGTGTTDTCLGAGSCTTRLTS
jgi:hypothetical protein